MGYTHYWKVPKDISKETWDLIADDATKILEAAKVKFKDVPLAYEYDEPKRKPLIDDDAIHFNGVDEDGHEAFYFTPARTDFSFCKTAGKPYDVVVVAMLAMLKDRLRAEIDVTSDGDLEEWSEGVQLANAALGRSIAPPI